MSLSTPWLVFREAGRWGPWSDLQPWTDSDGVGPKYKAVNPAAQLRHDSSLALSCQGLTQRPALCSVGFQTLEASSQRRTAPSSPDAVHGSDHLEAFCWWGSWPPQSPPTLCRAWDLGRCHTVTPQAVGACQSVSSQGQAPAPASRHLGQVRWGGGRSWTAPCRQGLSTLQGPGPHMDTLPLLLPIMTDFYSCLQKS